MIARDEKHAGGNGQSHATAAPAKPRWSLLDVPAYGAIAARQPAGWLVDGILPAGGIVLLVGPARAGKSTVATTWAIDIAEGKPWAGATTSRGPVVLVAADRPSPRDTHELVLRAAAGRSIDAATEPLDVLVLDGAWSLDDAEAVAWLAAELDRLGAVLVVLDSLRRLTALNDCLSEHMAEVARQLGVLSGGGRRCVLLLHHAAKGGSPRGSTDLVAMADTTIYLAPLRGDVLRLRAEHHRCAPVELAVRIERQDDWLRAVRAEDTPAGAEEPRDRTAGTVALEGAILDVLRAHDGKAKSARELGGWLREAGHHATEGDLGPALDALAEGGRIMSGPVKQGRSRWVRLPE